MKQICTEMNQSDMTKDQNTEQNKVFNDSGVIERNKKYIDSLSRLRPRRKC